MRKLSLFALGLIAAAATFTSCTKDTNKLAPTITFQVGSSEVTTTTAKVGDNLSFTIKVHAPADIKQITFYKGKDDASKTSWGSPKTSGFVNDTIDEIVENYTVVEADTAGLKFFVTVVDKNSQESSNYLTVTVSKPVVAGEINTYTAVLLGSNSNNSAGSYLSTSTGEVFFSTDKQNKASLIDIIYGTTSAGVDEFFSPAIALSGITGGNATKFATSTVNFDNVSDDTLLQGLTADQDQVSGIAPNTVYQFVTAAGKKGVFKVTAYTAGKAGSVTINVKVQK